MLTNLAIPLLLVLLVGFMFLGTRKQKRTMQQQQEMQKSLTFGDRVMTTSGLYATVVSTDEDTVDLEIADGVTTTWLRAAVREKVTETPAELIEDDEFEDVAEIDEVESAETTEEPESGAQVAPPLEETKKAR